MLPEVLRGWEEGCVVLRVDTHGRLLWDDVSDSCGLEYGKNKVPSVLERILQS